MTRRIRTLKRLAFAGSLAGTLFSSLLLAPTPVDAQAAICGNYKEVVASLRDGYSEKPVSMGLGVDGNMVEVFASAKGSFTIVVTQPNGQSCVLAAGQNWENTARAALGRET
ncbi:MAG: hypothetical protein ACPGNT_08435 [Rhodospirillales bacterium]